MASSSASEVATTEQSQQNGLQPNIQAPGGYYVIHCESLPTSYLAARLKVDYASSSIASGRVPLWAPQSHDGFGNSSANNSQPGSHTYGNVHGGDNAQMLLGNNNVTNNYGSVLSIEDIRASCLAALFEEAGSEPDHDLNDQEALVGPRIPEV